MAGEDFNNQPSSLPSPSSENFSDEKAVVDPQIISGKPKEAEEEEEESEDEDEDVEDLSDYQDSDEWNMEDTRTISDAGSTNLQSVENRKKITANNITFESHKNELIANPDEQGHKYINGVNERKYGCESSNTSKLQQQILANQRLLEQQRKKLAKFDKLLSYLRTKDPALSAIIDSLDAPHTNMNPPIEPLVNNKSLSDNKS